MHSSTSHHLLGTPVALLLAAATSLGCQSADSPHVRAMDHSSRPTYVAQYGVSSHASAPRQLNPSVDGSLSVTGMHWRVWNAHRAVGTGTAHVNDCKPDCADGHFSSHPVTVRLGHPRIMCGSRFFTTLRITGSGYHSFSRWSHIGCR